LEKFLGFLKIRCRFLGKSDQNIRSERSMGQPVVEIIENTLVIDGTDFPSHLPEDPVTSTLQRKMKMWADLWGFHQILEFVVTQKSGVERTQSYPAQTFDPFQLLEQIDQRGCPVLASAIETEVHSCEDDLFKSLVHIFLDLTDNLIPAQAYAGATYMGNDTKGAPEVTPILDFHQRT
jgi:hypothetical protein